MPWALGSLVGKTKEKPSLDTSKSRKAQDNKSPPSLSDPAFSLDPTDHPYHSSGDDKPPSIGFSVKRPPRANKPEFVVDRPARPQVKLGGATRLQLHNAEEMESDSPVQNSSIIPINVQEATPTSPEFGRASEDGNASRPSVSSYTTSTEDIGASPSSSPPSSTSAHVTTSSPFKQSVATSAPYSQLPYMIPSPKPERKAPAPFQNSERDRVEAFGNVDPFGAKIQYHDAYEGIAAALAPIPESSSERHKLKRSTFNGPRPYDPIAIAQGIPLNLAPGQILPQLQNSTVTPLHQYTQNHMQHQMYLSQPQGETQPIVTQSGHSHPPSHQQPGFSSQQPLYSPAHQIPPQDQSRASLQGQLLQPHVHALPERHMQRAVYDNRPLQSAADSRLRQPSPSPSSKLDLSVRDPPVPQMSNTDNVDSNQMQDEKSSAEPGMIRSSSNRHELQRTNAEVLQPHETQSNFPNSIHNQIHPPLRPPQLMHSSSSSIPSPLHQQNLPQLQPEFRPNPIETRSLRQQYAPQNFIPSRPDQMQASVSVQHPTSHQYLVYDRPPAHVYAVQHGTPLNIPPPPPLNLPVVNRTTSASHVFPGTSTPSHMQSSQQRHLSTQPGFRQTTSHQNHLRPPFHGQGQPHLHNAPSQVQQYPYPYQVQHNRHPSEPLLSSMNGSSASLLSRRSTASQGQSRPQPTHVPRNLVMPTPIQINIPPPPAVLPSQMYTPQGAITDRRASSNSPHGKLIKPRAR